MERTSSYERATGGASQCEHAEEVVKTLFSISNAVNTTENLDDLYRSIHTSLAAVIDVANFFIAIVDIEKCTLHFPYHQDECDTDFSELTDFDASRSLTGKVVLERKPILLKEKEIKERSDENGVWGPVPRIWMGVPLIVRNAVIGVMAVQSYTDPGCFDNRDLKVLLAVSDQTAIAIDRKRAEGEIKRLNQFKETIIENANIWLNVLDEKGNVLIWNKAAESISGYAKEEVVGHDRIWKWAYPDREYRSGMKAKQAAIIEKGEVLEDFETNIRRKDGKERTISWNSRNLLDDQENLIGSIATGRDITERRRSEEEKKRLAVQLQNARKMEAIGTLAGGVAHDLNNILSGLVSYPELLLMDLPEESPIRDGILLIQNSGKRAAAIVQDLLTLARRGVVAAEVVELNRIITDYLESPEYKTLLTHHHHVRLETDLGSNLLKIKGSSVHLSKTVMNLVSNAAEAMPDGGKIAIATRNRYLDSPVKGYDDVRAGDYVTLTVSDQGGGILPEDMERIFEPFYTKKVMGRSGTGLGMAVVWGTVKDHKGYIDVRTEEGKGSHIILYFPITREELAKSPSSVSMQHFMGRGERIVAVDDVKEQRVILSTILKTLNYSAQIFPGGEEAVEYMKTHAADLLILDMIMDPGIDGLETYRRILEHHPGQKAIIVSGYSETERVRETRKLGAGAYVKKPYLLGTIGPAIRKGLE